MTPLLCVDDAGNRFFGRFYDHEEIYPAMDSLRRYIERYGLPQSIYQDKHSTYKITRRPDVDRFSGLFDSFLPS